MNRAAVYLSGGRGRVRVEDLRRQFKRAQEAGLRIVSVTREGPGGRGRPVFEQLVARMDSGEFEAILAVAEPRPSFPLPSPRAGIALYPRYSSSSQRSVAAPDAAVVQRIYRAFAAGASTTAICEPLNAEGVPNPRHN
jgi:hypothetical protein